MVEREFVGGVVEIVEGTTMALAHADESLVCPAGHLGDLLGAGIGEGVKAQHACVIADVHAVERERMKMDVETERGVGALDESDRAELRVVDRAQAQLELGSATQRASQRADEHREHIGAEPTVVAHRVAQPPRQRADPLPDRDLGQHLVDEMSRDVGHASAET